ncbi:MAG: GGDEF domain-containing protein [Gemmatimonadaceae bacterium]
MSADIVVALGLAGALTQLGSTVLILLLMLLLSAEQRTATHFRYWTNAWLVLAVGLTAIVLRYSHVGDGLNLWKRGESDVIVRLLYLTYATTKLWFLALLVAGVRWFRAPDAKLPSTSHLGLAALTLATVVVAMITPLNGIMIVQSVVAVPAFTISAVTLLVGTSHRRSTGTLLLAVALGAHAILWTIYGVAFSLTALDLFKAWLSWIPRFNSYFDAILQTLMAYAMVALLMERTTQESRDAHARLQEAHAALRRAAMYDPLTGALNRQAFSEGMGLEAAMKISGTVTLIDVDHLKPINDSLGHTAGDSLLRHVSQSVSNVLRADDALYRWGGDEFLVILPGSDETSARCIMDKALATGATLSYAGILLPVRVSYGCAPYDSRDTLDDAIQAADRAMYEAKGARRPVRAVSPTGVVAVGYSSEPEPGLGVF